MEEKSGTKNKSAEVSALAPIPLDQRKSWISLTFVQAGICVCCRTASMRKAAAWCLCRNWPRKG